MITLCAKNSAQATRITVKTQSGTEGEAAISSARTHGGSSGDEEEKALEDSGKGGGRGEDCMVLAKDEARNF